MSFSRLPHPPLGSPQVTGGKRDEARRTTCRVDGLFLLARVVGVESLPLQLLLLFLLEVLRLCIVAPPSVDYFIKRSLVHGVGVWK